MSAPQVPSLALVILDGWGLAPPGPGNAISLADTPVFDELWEGCPHTRLSANTVRIADVKQHSFRHDSRHLARRKVHDE